MAKYTFEEFATIIEVLQSYGSETVASACQCQQSKGRKSEAKSRRSKSEAMQQMVVNALQNRSEGKKHAE